MLRRRLSGQRHSVSFNLASCASITHAADVYCTARQALENAEKAQASAVADRKAAETRIATLEQQIHDFEARLEDENRGYADAELLNRRLAEEMESERDQYQKDLSDRDFTIDQTRQKYQSKQLSSDRLVLDCIN